MRQRPPPSGTVFGPPWLWGPIALALLISGMAFLITLAVGKTSVRDTTTTEATVLDMAQDATYAQRAAEADTQRHPGAAQDAAVERSDVKLTAAPAAIPALPSEVR